MKKVNFSAAIGESLAHDICEIKGTSIKKVAFKRGHIIKAEDEAYFLELGKQHFFVLEAGDDDLIHEEDAANIMFETINNGDFIASEIAMGKINFIANETGFFKVDHELLTDFNMLSDISAACINDMQYVKKGDLVASMRIIPLFTTTKHIEQIRSFTNAKEIFKIMKIKNINIHQITTGSEVYNGLVEDGFRPKLNNILAKYDVKVTRYNIIDDKLELITSAIKKAYNDEAQLILVTGGMSVDPDDLTPGAIKASGANIISYGTPIIPGSMFLYSELEEVVILGLPGAVIFEEQTAFDLLLPYALTGAKICKRDIMQMCVGGILNG